MPIPSMARSTGRALTALSWALAVFAAQATAKSAADYYVRDLPGVPTDGPLLKMHAG